MIGDVLAAASHFYLLKHSEKQNTVDYEFSFFLRRMGSSPGYVSYFNIWKFVRKMDPPSGRVKVNQSVSFHDIQYRNRGSKVHLRIVLNYRISPLGHWDSPNYISISYYSRNSYNTFSPFSIILTEIRWNIAWMSLRKLRGIKPADGKILFKRA